MPHIRNANGQYMTATSNNSLDAHIPSNGMHSRIMAKNLHEGDTLALRGAPNRPVAAIVEGPKSTIYVGFMNESGTGLKFRGYSSRQRVSIIETPCTRKMRRDISRLG